MVVVLVWVLDVVEYVEPSEEDGVEVVLGCKPGG